MRVTVCGDASRARASFAGVVPVFSISLSSSTLNASGSYTLPVVAAAMERGAKALYLFTTKAPAQDQVAELL